MGLLDYETTLQARKRLERVSGKLRLPGSPSFSGYEIHVGTTHGPALDRAAVEIGGRADGALSVDGQIFATYAHGVFDTPESCSALLAWAGLDRPQAIDYAALRERSIDRLADAMAANLDLGALFVRALKPVKATA